MLVNHVDDDDDANKVLIVLIDDDEDEDGDADFFFLETIDYQGWFLAKWGWQGDGLLSQSNLGGRKMTPSANKEGGLG